MSTTRFDIIPEERATYSAFIKRQLFGGAPATSKAQVNLEGKTAVVTGSNTGIGLECARQLLDLGLSRLIIAVRNVTSGESARTLLLQGRHPGAHDVDVWKLDLSVYDSVISFAKDCESLKRLDIFIQNAGISKDKFELHPTTGHEESIQVNHLSTALLTILLLPVLQKKNSPETPGKIIIVSSETAAWAKFKEREATPMMPEFDKPENFNQGEYGIRYWTSKLLGQFFLAELVKRVSSPSSSVIINACNPGLCYGSSLLKDHSVTPSAIIMRIIFRLLGFSTSKGAQSLVDAACNHGSESHAIYIEDGKLQPMAPMVYTSEGARVMEKVWMETMEELKFAGVQDIIKGMGASQNS